jgi:hypothetical protein
MQLLLKVLGGKTLALNFSTGNISVEEVKQLIWQKEGIPTGRFFFRFVSVYVYSYMHTQMSNG